MGEHLEQQAHELPTHKDAGPVLPQKPGEWLDNPLPVPKRHVKKELDYGFEPSPEQMCYDIAVSDEDDFDIG